MVRSIGLLGGLASIASAVLAIYTPQHVGYNTSQAFKVPFTLTSGETLDHGIVDYGGLTSGFPVFGIANASGSYIELEIKYSENYPALSLPDSDGPYPFASMLANNWRVETVNVTEVIANNGSQFQSFWIQGSQRWQSLRLTQGDQITFSYLGFEPTSATTAKQDASGNATLHDTNSTFQCSNEIFNRIWNLGGKAAQHACLYASTQPASVELGDDRSQGLFIRGQRAPRFESLSRVLPSTDYTFAFQTKIQRGGFGFALNAGMGGAGLLFYVTGPLENSTTFSNWDRSRLPANSLTIAEGYDIVNQTSLTSYYLTNQALMLEMHEDEWYNVTATFSNSTIYGIDINGQRIASFNRSSYSWLPTFISPPYLGPPSIGLAGHQYMDAYYRNAVVAYSNGTQVWNNSLTSSEAIADLGVAENEYAVCMDGGKRDRLVWLGDFYVTATSMAVSTQNFDVWKGTLQQAVDYSLPTGAVGISNPLGLRENHTFGAVVATANGLADYQLDFLNSAHLYYMTSGDKTFISKNWDAFEAQTNVSLAFVDPETQLWAPPIVFKGLTNGTSSSSQLVLTLRNMAELAYALDKPDAAYRYISQANATANAVQTLLYNSTSGIFSSSLGNGNFSILDLAFSVMANISTPEQTQKQIAELEQLRYGIGYKTDSTVVGDVTTNLAPYPSSFLLEALGQSNSTEQILYLLNGLWAAMAAEGPYHTGASWEYLLPDGTPGLGNFTSLDHPWGSGATALLTRYGLGLRPLGVGYSSWTFAPLNLGLEYASGVVQTPYGPVTANWTINAGGKLQMRLTAPANTMGTIVPPISGSYTVNNGNVTSTFPIHVEGGSTIIVQQV